MRLNELPYPMFECTKEEIELLLKVKQKIEKRLDYYICFILIDDDPDETAAVNNLLTKIQCSLGDNANNLISYFDREHGFAANNFLHAHLYRAREIWIDKLVEFNRANI